MTKKIFFFLFVLLLHFAHAQSITFISEKTNKPLPKVSVFAKDGSIVAFSDIDGKINKQSLKPEQEKFQLVYDNISVATLAYSDFNHDVIKINDRIKDIETVVVKKEKPAKYIFVKGNFNAYVTLNNKLNSYADGIVTYIFDNKTKKLKSTQVEQYRIFRLENAEMDRKKLSSWDYGMFLKVPKLKNIENVDGYKTIKDIVFKELKSEKKDQIELTEITNDEEMGFLGYRISDAKNILNISYVPNSQKKLRDLLEYNRIEFVKLKHKSEPQYNDITIYNNFYPIDIDFGNEKIEKMQFDINSSHYTTKYWEDPDFPNMQPVFSSFFKEDLKEKPNQK
ncbi:hypothetical protein QE422_000593 [Chryseobacterium sp. SORGH_AS 447]|uniref:hypothetical protein n=1 Tax=Chryseobacterium sp. SORGH_AS_0447 TaxID=3041769 RepID=UPI002789EAA6|nr:hypothetical protein [Chryseobacterium sp. SORGH_AS_0447]MDQ1160225.1 hypothetical protein [Chryseobacterium sp. SORGH_AS_0447]